MQSTRILGSADKANLWSSAVE